MKSCANTTPNRPNDSGDLDLKSRVFILLLVGLAIVFVAYLSIGSSSISPERIVHELIAGDTGQGTADNIIIWRLRLPRALACILVGALLGSVGSSLQALFRNPLADPYIVGVASGSAVGRSLLLVLGQGSAIGPYGSMAAGFVTGCMALFAVLGLATKRGVVVMSRLLLAGVVVGSLLSSVVTLALLMNGQDTLRVQNILLGSMTPMDWPKLFILFVTLILGGYVLIMQSKKLNAFAIGEETAARLGVDTRRLKPIILLTSTAMTAAAVSTVGVIGFVGLVAPHMSRRMFGVDWRVSLIGAALVGSILLLSADLAAQRALPGGELPVGVVTAVLGAPFLLLLMRRER